METLECYLAYAAELHSGDGVSTYDTWAGAHNAAEATGVEHNPLTVAGIAGYYNTYGKFACYRSCLTIDTSALPSNARISLAILKGTTLGGVDSVLHVVEGVHGDTAQASDFGSLLSKVESYGQVDWPGSPAPFELTLNAAGLDRIVKGGQTKFGLRLDNDINNEEPTGPVEFIISRGSIELYIEYTVSEPEIHPTHPTHPEHPSC
ncbi:MAG: hypothetical protein WC551_07920 [Patescibacteria group bacterium]